MRKEKKWYWLKVVKFIFIAAVLAMGLMSITGTGDVDSGGSSGSPGGGSGK